MNKTDLERVRRNAKMYTLYLEYLKRGYCTAEAVRKTVEIYEKENI